MTSSWLHPDFIVDPIRRHRDSQGLFALWDPILQLYNLNSSIHPTIKCYTFLETSHEPLQGLQLICKFFAIFFVIQFCNQAIWNLPEVLPPSVIPFWKPLMTLYKDCNSFANFLQIFLQPNFATTRYEVFKKSCHQVLYLLQGLQLVCKFFATLFANPNFNSLYKKSLP